jgi:hypothetical protein
VSFLQIFDLKGCFVVFVLEEEIFFYRNVLIRICGYFYGGMLWIDANLFYIIYSFFKFHTSAIIIKRFAYRFDNLFGPFVGITALFDFLIKGKEY